MKASSCRGFVTLNKKFRQLTPNPLGRRLLNNLGHGQTYKVAGVRYIRDKLETLAHIQQVHAATMKLTRDVTATVVLETYFFINLFFSLRYSYILNLKKYL